MCQQWQNIHRRNRKKTQGQALRTLIGSWVKNQTSLYRVSRVEQIGSQRPWHTRKSCDKLDGCFGDWQGTRQITRWIKKVIHIRKEGQAEAAINYEKAATNSATRMTIFLAQLLLTVWRTRWRNDVFILLKKASSESRNVKGIIIFWSFRWIINRNCCIVSSLDIIVQMSKYSHSVEMNDIGATLFC